MTNAKQNANHTKRHHHRKKNANPVIPLEPQIILAYEFYNEYKVNYLLDNQLIRGLMRNVIKQRKEIIATEADIDRALAAVDTNHDNKINFDQFIKFMQLFFATNNTLKERLERVCNYILGNDHTKPNSFLKPYEVAEIDEFFHNFYGKKTENKTTGKSKKNIEFSKYISGLEKEFRGCTFVRISA